MKILRFNTVVVFLFIATTWATTARSDWPSWRGPNDIGSTQGGNYPVKFDETALQWRADLPGKGCSTPIVLDETIYLTAPANGHDAILSIDKYGEQQWVRTFGAEVTGKHRNGSGCNASPVTDGEWHFRLF